MQTPGQGRRERGFTLTELMIVIVILGILAAIAIISFRKYVQYSKTSEVYTMLGDIRAKQEGYRAEFSQYCAVNGQDLSTAPYPNGAPKENKNKTSWPSPPTNVNWQLLGFTTHAPTYGGYKVAAGLPGQAPSGTGGTIAGFNANDHWWIAWGHLDLDGDGEWMTFEALNQTTDIVVMDGSGNLTSYE